VSGNAAVSLNVRFLCGRMSAGGRELRLSSSALRLLQFALTAKSGQATATPKESLSGALDTFRMLEAHLRSSQRITLTTTEMTSPVVIGK